MRYYGSDIPCVVVVVVMSKILFFFASSLVRCRCLALYQPSQYSYLTLDGLVFSEKSIERPDFVNLSG